MEQKMEDATRHFLLSQFSQSMMMLQEVMRMEVTKRSIVMQNIVNNDRLLCSRQLQKTLIQEGQPHLKTFEEMLQLLKGVLPSRKTVMLESLIEYNRFITILQQSSNDQVEVTAALVESKVREYLEKVEQTLDKSDIPVVLLKCLQTVSQLLAGMEVPDWSMADEKKAKPQKMWQAVMQIPSGCKKLKTSGTESGDELSLTGTHDIIKCLDACQRGSWVQALKLIKHGRTAWKGLLACEMNYVKAYCLYQLSSFEKAKRCLHKLLLRSDLSSSVKVRGHQLLGCCLAEQGKHNLAVQEFRQALASDFREFLPLGIYNLSSLYRKMEAMDAELGVFNLLMPVSLEDRNTCDGPLLAFAPDAGPSLQPSVSELQILFLYHLSNRCFELKRYEAASEKYLELISLLEETPVIRLSCNSLLPMQPKSIMEIYLEAAVSLLQVKKFEDAETVCDIIISRSRGHKVKGQTPSDAQSQSRKKIQSSSFASHVRDSSCSEGPSTSYEGSGDRVRLSSSTKHYLKSSPDNSEIRLTLASAFLVKGECLLKMKDIGGSLESIEDSLIVLHEYSAVCREEEETGGTFEPTSKKRKLESGETETKQHGPFHNKFRKLKARCYNNKAVILIGQNKLKDALPVLLSSLECYPESIDARINYCLLLFKLGRKKEAYTEWRSLQQNSP